VWWPDTMHVRLAPDRLEYRVQAPLSRAVRATGVVECAPSGATRRPAWSEACAALATLTETKRQGRLSVDLVVSDRLVRYQVLPWRPGIVSRAEWRAYALHSLQSVFGDVDSSWYLHVDMMPPGRTTLACAVDNEFIEALRKATANSATRLVAVRPNFLDMVRRRRPAMRGSRFWFAAVEANHIALGLAGDGGWRALRNESVADGWRATLPGLIRRVQLALPESCVVPLYLCGADFDGAAPDAIEGLPVRLLGAKSRRPESADNGVVAGG
jgi:hypothetical protein